MDGNGTLAWLVFFPVIGAGVAYLIGRKSKAARDYAADIITIVEFAAALYVFAMYHMAWQLSGNPANSFGYPSSCNIFEVCGMGLHFTLDGFRALYGKISI